MPRRQTNSLSLDHRAKLHSESESHQVNTPNIPQNPESFSAECWYRTALLRLLIEDLEAALAGNAASVDAQMIRDCESPLRDLLGKSWKGKAEELAQKNRSRLKVFDRRVGEGISNPAWLDLEQLRYTLEVWQRRLLEDQPSLWKKLFEELRTLNVQQNDQNSASGHGGRKSTSPTEVLQSWNAILEKTIGHTALSTVENEHGEWLQRLRSMI